MKLKVLAASLALAYSSLHAQVQTGAWETIQYNRNNFSKFVNVSSAYSKDCIGYKYCAGQGSIIAILDSGIDNKNSDLTSKIIASFDFAARKNGVWDTIGHGTHIAGIAVGSPFLVNGIAFESKILNAKITDTNTANIGTDLELPISWAVSNRADVINLSMNKAWSKNTPISLSPDKKSYIGNFTVGLPGSIPMGEVGVVRGAGNSWKEMATRYPLLYNVSNNVPLSRSLGETVIVLAAGNDGKPYSGMWATMATETIIDRNKFLNNLNLTKNETLSVINSDTGKLLFNGQVLVVGNWDPSTNKMNPSSNLAGTICRLYQNNQCLDKYKISDFYLVAPGTNILSYKSSTFNSKIMTGLRSTDNTGTPIPAGTTIQSGTSMAAPVVSGAVALIHQIWPQMTGANIAKLLLVTANKNIPGYDPLIMGQGLLDLEQATKPIGKLGIPTTGRLTGPKLFVLSPILVTSGSISTAGVGSIISVDGFDRHYEIDARVLTAYKTIKDFNPQQAFMPYDSKNNYSLFNNYNQRFSSQAGNLEFALYQDTNNSNVQVPGMIEMSYKVKDFKFTTAHFSEQATWLNNSLLGVNRESNTLVLGLGYEKAVLENTRTYANVMHGITGIKSYSDKVSGLNTAYSYSWTAGVEQDIKNLGTLGLMAYQPVSIYNAQANINMPVGLDANYNVIQSTRSNLAADVKETRLGLYYKLSDRNTNTFAFIEARQNYRGQDGVKDTAVGLRFTGQF